MILTHPSIDPVIFSINFIEIRWYSIAYIATFIIGSYVIKLFNSKINNKIDNKLIDSFFVWSIIGVIFGGRIGYVLFYQIELFILNPLYLIYIWEGGMSFHGGLIGMTLAILFFSKRNKISFFSLADLVSIVAPIGLFLGRIANFINVELIGRITDFPIAMIYPTIDNFPRHPSQIYEALFEGIILFIILFYIYSKNFSTMKHGYLSGYFLLFYGIFRFLIEFLREPDQHLGLIFNVMTVGQILCIPLIFIGVFIIKIKKNYV